MNIRDAAESIEYRVAAPRALGQQATPDWCFMSQLPAAAREALAAAARVSTFARRQVMASQGDRVQGLACVPRGLVRCWLIDAEGNDYTVETAWSNSLSLVGLGGPESEWPWNVSAVVPTTRCMIPWEALTAVRRRYRIDEALMTYAAHDYRRRHLWHGTLRSVKLRPRLLMILRRMGDEFGDKTPQGTILHFPVTHSDLAALASVTRDEVGRVMREFVADDLVSPIGRRGLLIPKLDRLGEPPEVP